MVHHYMSVVGEGTRRLVHHYMSVYHSISLLSSPAKFLIISTVPWGFCKLSQMNHSFMNTNIQMCFITFCCIIPLGNQNTCCIIPLGNQNTYPSPHQRLPCRQYTQQLHPHHTVVYVSPHIVPVITSFHLILSRLVRS